EGMREAAEGGPITLQILPGKLSAQVYAHTISNGPIQIPCWTYITTGLWKLGQKDFIFSLRRDPSEPLAIVYGGSLQDGGRVLEDGFTMLFNLGTWVRVLEAL